MNRISALAEELKLDHDDLGFIFGVHPRTAQRWLSGDFLNEPPYVGLVLRLMIRYKLTVNDVKALAE